MKVRIIKTLWVIFILIGLVLATTPFNRNQSEVRANENQEIINSERRSQELPPEGSPTAVELANAIITPSTLPFLVSVNKTGRDVQFEVYSASLQGFPIEGSSWALISTGKASSIAGTAPTFYSFDTNGSSASGWSNRGLWSYDIATLILWLSVPPGATTLSFNWKFATEENPTYTWSYRDTAKAIITTSTGSVNVLLLPDGNPVDVGSASYFSNPVGCSSPSPCPPFPEPNDTVYNAVTGMREVLGIYKASFDVAPYVGETIRIDFQIGDERDQILDSALFIDNLNIEVPPPEKWSFAVITDLHIGRGYPDYGGEGWDDSGTTGQDYYLTERLEKVVEEIKRLRDEHNIKFVAVLGDITDSGEYSEFEKAKEILDELNYDVDTDGKFDMVYIPIIGNHDPWPETDESEASHPLPTFFHEVFGSQFDLLSGYLPAWEGPEGLVYMNYALTLQGVTFIFLDFAERREPSALAILHAETLNWLSEHLQTEAPTVILSHHPLVGPQGGFSPIDIFTLDETIKISNANVLASFGGHYHGFYDPSREWVYCDYPWCNPWFMDANAIYVGTPLTGVPEGIPAITTEALMVASNEPAPKGIIRLVKVKGNEVTIPLDVEGEFRAVNPYFLERVPVVLSSEVLTWPGVLEDLKNGAAGIFADFEGYAFTKRFTKEPPLPYKLTYILDFGDGSEPREIESDEVERVTFRHYYRPPIKPDRTYDVTLTVRSFTPDKKETIEEKITKKITLPRQQVIITHSPVDVAVTDPNGLTISKQLNEILGANYVEFDLDEDGDPDDIIVIPDPKLGDYLINVIPEPSATSTDTYTLRVIVDNVTFLLAENVQISNIPMQPYIVRSTETEIIPIIPAIIDFDPDTLNLKSQGSYATVYTELPVGHGYTVSNIDVASIILNGQVQAELRPTEIGDYDVDGIPDLMVKFNRAAIQAILEVGEDVEVTVYGRLNDGRLFEGKDRIKVIRPS